MDVFVRFQKGEIKRLPWAETDELKKETELISNDLVALNQAGLLTLNS